MADNDEDDYFDAPYEPPPSHTSRMSTQRRRTSVFSNLNSSNGLPSAAMPPSLTGRRGSVAPGISGGRRTSRAGLVSTPPEIFGSRNSAKARAKAFWEILRQHVKRGFFRTILSLPEPATNSTSIVNELWAQLNKYSGAASQDSTLDFVKAGSAAAQRPSCPSPPLSGLKNDKKTSPLFRDKTEIGLDGLSFDSVPNVKVASLLMRIAQGLLEPMSNETDFYSKQVFLNRSWKLLVTGLTQAESLSRHVAILSLRKVIPVIKETLLDDSTRVKMVHILVNLMVSDEQRENSLKAIYLLGQIGFYLGSVRDYNELILIAFKSLARMILSVHSKEYSLKSEPDEDTQQLKICLYHAIGKFTCHSHEKTDYIHNISLYLIHKEFDVLLSGEKVEADGGPKTYVLLALLGILDNEFYRTSSNFVYIGALFKRFVHPLMRSAHLPTQKMAVQFVGNWFPIAHKMAFVLGLDAIIAGLGDVRQLVGSEHSQFIFDHDLANYAQTQDRERLRIAYVDKNLHVLSQPPGSWTSLYAVPNHPGLFMDANSSLRNTRSIFVELPIDSLSNVSISRPIPQIPGVPKGMTTVPFLFADDSTLKTRKPPTTHYEFLENAGRAPGLPPGFTYSPTATTEKKDDPPLKANSAPPGTTLQPPKMIESVPRRIPYGFLGMCPHPGYDPERTDKNKIRYSAIYGGNVTSGAVALTKTRVITSGENGLNVPEGATTQRHPILWPCRTALSQLPDDFDFPLYAPVVFDIVQPKLGNLQRILTRVTGISQELFPILSEINGQPRKSVGELLIGSRFNVYIRSRQSDVWIAVHLEVEDDCYDDDMDFFRYASNSAIRKSSSVLGSQMVQSEAIRKRIFGVSPYIFTLPIPVGVTAGGDPYFAPPVTLPPFPSGYTPEGIPFYGRASIVQPHVLGITSSGVRYYSNDGKLLTADTPSRYLTAGYSYSGHAFYLPRGLAFPAPTGFTSDGIAFYDIPSMLLYPGNLLLPQSFAMLDQDLMSEDDKFNAMLAKGLNSEELAGFLSCMKSQLTQQFAYLQSSLRKMDRKSNSNLFIEGSLKDLARRASLHDFFEPMDVAPLLQSVDQFAHTKSCSLRLCLEPSLVAFQSMTLSSTKTAVLRFRVSRGDRDSRDFFISAQPSNLFSVNLSRIVVQGEGVQNVEVTFDPNAMTSQQTEGLLTLIDDSGKCHTSCSLVGLRQSFFKALPGKLEGGWILPGRSKTLYVKITNTSGIQVSLTLCLESERRSLGSQEALKGAEACSILKSNVKLQPQESVQVPILLSRDVPGKYLDTVEVVGPGGDVSRIPVEFKCGNPVVIHPESEEDSKVPLQALSRERTHFLNRFSLAQKDMIDYRTSVTARDTPIFKSIIAATTDFTGAPFSCTVDFGICARSKTKFSRSVTFLNVTDATMTIALKSQSPFVSAPYVLTIAARAAQTVSVELCVNPDDAVCKGNINTYIDVICSEFEGCKIQVFAFVGEPLYFPIWEYSFFKACRLYQKDSITAFLVNDSQYPFDVSVSRSHNESNRLSSILCSLDRRWRIEAFSIIPVHFEYRADDLGPYMQVFDLQVHSPFKAVLKPTVNSTSLKLIGICLEPILSSERGQDSKGIDFIRKWLSQPSRIFEEYPTASERKRLFDLPINKSTQKEIVLEDSGPIRYEMASLYSDSGSGATGYNSFRSLSQKLQISNLSDKLHSSVIFSTPFFTPNARNKTLQPNESQTVEVLFSPPTDFPPFLRVHGGLFSFSDGNGSCDSCQLLNNLQTNVLVSPLQNGDGINVLDFGNIEVATGLSVSCEKTFTIFNMMDCTIIWTTKISQAKYNNFSFSSIEGEILANESQTVTVTFQTDSHGDFETKIDVLVKNSLQTKGAPVKVAFIHVRGVAYAFSMSGIPDSMDLGSSLVSQERSNQFEMLNNGSCSVSLRLFTSAPFSVFPAEKILGVKASVVVTVSFKPSESRNVTSTLQIFAGNKQFSVSLCGIGGTVELMAHEKSIDFGRQQEDTICWASLFLSNRGSLPLSLLNITADNPELLKLQFLGVTNTSSQDQQNTTFIEKDYWAILKRKKNFAKVAMGNKPFQQIHLKKSTTIRGESIPIRRLSQDPSPIISRIIPVLHPFQAYHFRLGYRGTYGRLSGTSIFFDYGSLVTEVKNVESKKNTFERIPVTVRGTAYKTLDFFPLSYNFGLVAIAGDGEKVNPADTSMGIFDAGSTIKTCALEVSNMSIESENLFLDFIHPDFFVPNRDWHIQPGEKVLIHIEFRPSKAQVQCQGYAKFRFNRGHKFVYLSGTGACAHLLAPDEMDWGNMKIGSNMSKMLSLKNLGYMPSHFEMEIVQQSSDFKFVDSDPFEMVGCIEPGSSIEFKINCNCQSKDSRSAKIHIRWLKTPRGKWIQYEIPLKVKIGVPEFKLRNLEIDYGTVYIDNEKELPLTFSNTGNAVCGWTAEYANHYLFMDKVSGHLQPGQSTTIRVRFAPSTYDPLNVPVRFHTDAGSRTVTCYAIVGVPYLKIPLEHLNTKFGIVAVGKSQSQPVLLKNTGTKAIDFEVINVQQIENGNVMSSTEFDIFQFEPMSGTISATEMMILNLKAKPRQYLSTYELRYEVETKDGEIYKGGATAVGGQAIVKVKHTSVEAPGGSIAMTAEEEIRDIDSRRTIMSSHMEHLRELIAELRILEKEESVEPRAKLGPVRTTRLTPPESTMGSIKHSEAPVNVFSGSTPALKEGTEGHSPSQTLHEGSSTKQTTHAPKQLSSLIPDELAAELERLEHDFEMQINSLDFVSIKDSADQQFVTNAGLPSGLRPASQHAASKVRSRKYKGAKDPATNESFDTAHGEVEKENPSVTNVTQTHPNGSESQSGFSELIKSIEGESASIQQSTESIALENLSELATPGSNHLPMDLNLQPTDETSATEAFSQKRSIKEEKKILDKATNDITARTETIVKTVKSKLAALQSSGNREFLIETLQRLEKTAVDLKAGPPREDALLTDSTHNFGVILGGARSEELDLFQLSNTGNMSFDFVITALHSDCSQPPQEDEHEEGFRRQPFTVTPEYGSIQPGQALNVTAYFQAKSSGIYHQKFVVMSGEDEVRSFVLSARVGNPYVTCSPVIINFGLISRGEEVSRPLELTNGGSYGGSWKLEFADDDDNDSRRNSFFKLTEKEGYLEAGASFTAYIVFTPSREGDFSCKLRMIRARDTVPIAVTGTGGGSRFELKFVEHVDAQFNGLDWGTCIIGNQYQKRFLLTNAGNIEGFADLLYPRDLFTYVVERNHRNLISVVNGEAKSIDVIFEPTQVETCKDNLQITQVNGSAVLLPFRFKSGVCSWNVDGDLNFVNMKSGTRAERGISVTNDGTLDVILSFKLTTPIALPKKYYDIVTNPIFSAGKALKPGQKVIFTIGVVPEEIGSFEGSFVLSTDLGKGLIERAFTYNFDTFKEEFVLNSDADESVGRIMMGHSAQISRTMTNFGNSDIKWRVLMNSVTIAGEPASDILRGWSIVGDFSGIIPSHQTSSFTLKYTAPEEQFNDFVEATISVEKSEGVADDGWVTVSTFRVQGSNGVPKLILYPAEVRFGNTSILRDDSNQIRLANEGNAIVNYRVLPGWKQADEFFFPNESQMTGFIQPNAEILIDLCFKPKKSVLYETEIRFETQVTERALKVFGQGAEYKIHQESLPEIIDLGAVSLNEPKNFEFPIFNGCEFDISASCFVYDSDPLKESTAKMSLVGSVEPNEFVLNKSVDLSKSRVSETIRLKLNIEAEEDSGGVLDAEFLSRLLSLPAPQLFAKISVEEGLACVVPIQYLIMFSSIILLADGDYSVGQSELKPIDSLAFGTLPFSSGGVMSFVLHNPNTFAVRYWPQVDSDQYSISSDAAVIYAKEFSVLSVRLKSIDFTDEDIAPTSLTYDANLSLTFHLEQVPSISIKLTGTMVDITPELEVQREFQFGSVYSQQSKQIPFSMKNPARRPLQWKLVVESNYADIFSVVGDLQGTIEPLKTLEIKLNFEPKFAVDYSSKAYLETDQGNFVLDLFGTCVTPQLEADDDNKDFGTVGIGHAEVREVVVSNPTALPMTIRAESDNEQFETDVKEFVLEPGASRPVMVSYDPRMNAKQRGSIRFSFLESVPEDAVAAPKAVSLEQITESEDDVLTEEETKKGTLRKMSFSNRRALSVLKTVDFEGRGGTMSWKLNGREVVAQSIESSLASLVSASVEALETLPVETEPKGEVAKKTKKHEPSGLFSGLAPDDFTNTRKTTVPSAPYADRKPAEEQEYIPEGRSIEELAPLSDCIVSFQKITMGSSAQKTFEISNTGETMLDLTLKGLDGKTVKENKLMPCPGGFMELSMTPTSVRLPPSMTCVFEITVHAVSPGRDGMEFVVCLSNLVNPQAVPVRVSAAIVPITTSENLKAFVRSDTSVDHKIKMPLIQEAAYVIDPDIWKVLVPVLRLSSLRPSMDYRRVPFVEPNTTHPDLGPYLVRPPAIPAALSSQGRKWYSKRMSMSLENGGGANAANRRRSVAQQSMRGSMSGNTNNALTMMATYAETIRKRAEALELVKGMEKKVRVSDGPTGSGSTSSAVAMAAATARRGSTFQGAMPRTNGGAREEIETIEE